MLTFGAVSLKVSITSLGVPVINYGDVQNVWIFKQ